MKDTITIKESIGAKYKFIFAEPYYLTYYIDGLNYVHENNALDIYCYGSTLEDLQADFHEQLEDLYDLYVRSESNILTKCAKDMVELFKQLILNVEKS